jgi:ABC-type antimicrobial peptide transport system permease subunit
MASAVGLLCLALAAGGLRNRLLVRIGVRNMRRRPYQAGLLLLGLTLSTALIISSRGLDDSLTYSAQHQVVQEIGNLDETVTGHFDQAQLDRYLAVIRRQPDVRAAAGVATISGRYRGSFLQLNSDRTRLSMPVNYLYGVGADFEPAYGSFAGQSRRPVHAADIGADGVYLSMSFALNNDVQVGDRLTLSLGDRSVRLTVRGILANDIALTGADANSIPKLELIVPLPVAARLMETSQPVNLIAVANRNSAEEAGQRGLELERFLAGLFHLPAPDHAAPSMIPPDESHPAISALRTDSVAQASGLSFSSLLGGNSMLQFQQLVPAISLLMIGAGMLLLALLFLLLAAERRAELGMSRAIGLQRRHLVLMMLIEGCGYGCAAVLIGLPAGTGLVALELAALSHFPIDIFGQLHGSPMPLHLHVSPRTFVDAACASLLATAAVVLIVAHRLSRTNIVAAIRNLETSPAGRRRLVDLWHDVRARRTDSLGALLARLFGCGPLSLLLGAGLVGLVAVIPPAHRTDPVRAIDNLGWAVVIAGCGFLLQWVLSSTPGLSGLARRVGHSLIGIGWLGLGLVTSGRLFVLFKPTGNQFDTDSVAVELATTTLLFVAGTVLLVTANLDLLVRLPTALTARVRGLAPISRTSLSYPLTFPFRVTVTVSELGQVIFLVVLIITMNVGANDAAQAATATGGFQLQGIASRPIADLPGQVRRDPILNREIEVVAPLHRYRPDPPDGEPIDPVFVTLPGHLEQASSLQPTVMDDAFYTHTNFPVVARAAGFGSDRAMWDALIHRPDTAVMRYDSAVAGLPTGTFRPFQARIPLQDHTYRRVTVIGIVAPTTQWSFFYLSMATATAINGGPAQEARQDEGSLGYLFLLRPGVDVSSASRDLSERFAPASGLQLQQLYDSEQAASRANMTLFLGGALMLGLLFGAVAIGVIASRSVIERRQEIGMLRALGFRRRLVARSFLLESGFVISLSLLVGTGLALWIADRIVTSTYPSFPLPVLPLALVLAGSYLVAFLATALPARAASRIRPAEALRYE